MTNGWSKRSAGVALGVSACAVFLILPLFHWYGLQPRKTPLPGQVALAYLGKTSQQIVGESSVVEPNGKPNVAFRLTVTPNNGQPMKIDRLTIMSSDRSGRWSGGGKWDTYSEGIRAIGVAQDGKVLNPGAKQSSLKINARAPMTLDLFIDDGGMTSFWQYFTITVAADGGQEFSTVLERGTWRAVQR